ncbi:MAG TPA: phenylalanine--tRNA ligase subunit beta, partial [Bdellovibrionales bacterium]|nr:phenylalanine--tRNA ligase subunit beta [Bdellovibrionales bacterium]
KIRDVESLGMLASESELGLKKESEGILILPADAPVGKPFAEYFGLDDVVFEINVTPNRADCLSHLGLARELACLLDRPLKTKKADLKTSSAVSSKSVTLELKDSALCPRYSGRVIQGVKVGASPAWLKTRLESVGLNSINNVVDITNFIMMDLGQPLHAFDVAKLSGSKIVVDKATVGETFKTLDGTELKLTGDELTIRDGAKAVCIAGAIGGLNSSVTEQTTTLFIESAHFAMDSVRRTARRHGLQTDSAYRFSRGTDPSGVVNALEKACALIQQVAGGEVAADHWDLYPGQKEPRTILVRPGFIAQKLGYDVKPAAVENWLRRLGCQVTAKGPDFQVQAPAFRVDLEQEVDFVEEIGRLQGYDLIPDTLPPLSYMPLTYDKGFVFEQRVSELARAAGLSQCVNYGFTSSKLQSQWLGPVGAYKGAGLEMDSAAITVLNALSEDMNVMRVSLLPGLLKNMLHNYRHGNAQGLLFEVGYTFKRGPEGYVQEPRLAVIAWGAHQGLWQKPDAATWPFLDLKSRVSQILERLSIQAPQWNPWTAPAKIVHPAQSATLFVEGRNLGFLGSVHPQWLMDEKIRTGVAVGEFDLKALGRGQPRTVKFKSVSKFPQVERDLAFVLPKSVRAADVSTEIKKTAGALLQSIEIFDVFEGGNLPPGTRSVAYRMVYQDLEGTLNDERLTALQAQIVGDVEKKLQVKVR